MSSRKSRPLKFSQRRQALFLRLLGKKPIWLEDEWGNLYISANFGGYSYVYWHYRIGRVKLAKNYSISELYYIRYWAPYKPGKAYRRLYRQPRNQPAAASSLNDRIDRLLTTSPNVVNLRDIYDSLYGYGGSPAQTTPSTIAQIKSSSKEGDINLRLMKKLQLKQGK